MELPKIAWKKEGVVPVLAAFVILGTLSYFLLFSPKLKELRTLQADVVAAESYISSQLTAWGEMQRISPDEVGRWERMVHSWRDRVPETPETERFLEEISREAIRHNLRAFRLSVSSEGPAEKGGVAEGPGGAGGGLEEEKEKRPGPGELRYRVSFLSTYRDLAEFLESVPRMKRLLSIRSLAVREKEGEMETSLELSAYYGRRK